MKKINVYHVFAALLTILVAASCSADYHVNPDNSSNGHNPLQGTFKANINGELFQAEWKSFSDTTAADIRMIAVSATQFGPKRDTATYKSITFSIPNYEGPKTYYLNAGSASFSYYDHTAEHFSTFLSLPGDTLAAITVTGDQSSLVGTFQTLAVSFGPSGYGTDTIYISEGEFDLPR